MSMPDVLPRQLPTIKFFYLTIKIDGGAGEKKWHCMTCGKVFFSTVNKEVYQAFEGKIIKLAHVEQIKCWNCPTIYIKL